MSEVTFKTPLKKIKFKTSTSIKHQILNMLITVIIYDFNLLNIKILLDKTNNIPFIEGRGLFNNIVLQKKEAILIDESYNASPVSLNVCIDYFEKFEVNQYQRKIIIIGEMLELGIVSLNHHKEIVSQAIKSSIDMIIFSGSIYKEILTNKNLKSKKNILF